MRGRFCSEDSYDRRIFLLSGLFIIFVIATVTGIILHARSIQASVRTVVVDHAPTIKMAEVLVPRQTIEAGTVLEPSLFQVEARPVVGLPTRPVHQLQELRGEYSRGIIPAGQPLSRDHLTTIRPANRLTPKIPEGFRAVTIAVDSRSSVEGWVKPSAHVDVHWTYKVQGRPAISAICRNAEILSADGEMDSRTGMSGSNSGIPRTVTLLVTAQDASKIQLAQTLGTLSLSLRGDTDTGKLGKYDDRPVTIEDLYPKSSAASELPATHKNKITIRDPRSGVEETFSLDSDGRLVPNLS